MVRTEYSAVRKAEVRGIFVSLFNMFLVLFLLLSLVIALIVVAALLVHEKGKEYAGGIDGDPKKSGKRTLCEVLYCKQSLSRRLYCYLILLQTVWYHDLSIAKQTDDLNKSFFNSHDDTFPLSETVQMSLGKVKSRDFYKLPNVKRSYGSSALE